MESVAIGEAAIRMGVSVATMRRWQREGRLDPTFRTLGGHRRYDVRDLRCAKGSPEPEATAKAVVAYARVSTSQQRDDLTRQVERLRAHCRNSGWPPTKSSRMSAAG